MTAVSGGQYQEAIVERGGHIVGKLPYIMDRRGPFRVSRMPEFTHLLGPRVLAGAGKPQTRLSRRLSIVRSLIDQLPPLAYFEQHFDPTVEDGLAIADGLAFQDRGFLVAPQYTFEIDCRGNPEEIWNAMHFKTRQHIRRAEEKYSIRVIGDPATFIHCYLNNMKAAREKNRIDFEHFPKLHAECSARQSGEILAAINAGGEPVSMVYLVWGQHTMYYLLSTRGHDPADNGSINLLIWSGMKRAHERGLIFDLDGVYTSGTARFFSGFGGHIKTRLVARRSRLGFGVLQYLKLRYSQNETRYFT